MTDALIQALQQWGTAGIIAVAAGWVLYDSWKKNKETEKWMREQVQASTESHSMTRNDLSEINLSIKDLSQKHAEFREEISNRVTNIENKIGRHHPDHGSLEAVRLKAISTAAPAVYAIISDGLDSCDCDHIAVALLHNGTVALSGVPYIKLGIISEKYKPIRCPQDEPLLPRYKEEDIMSHNKLPMCVTQNKQAIFDISDDCILKDVDPIIYMKCIKRGIKRIAFEAIRDVHGLVTGFVVIYNFEDRDFDKDSLHAVTEAIEKVYQEMLFALS